jgi:hypothetical protein
VILPGGECQDAFLHSMDLLCTFGIMTRDRRLYLMAETQDDLQEWLHSFAAFVPDGVNITTPKEIEISWSSRGLLRMAQPRAPLRSIPTLPPPPLAAFCSLRDSRPGQPTRALAVVCGGAGVPFRGNAKEKPGEEFKERNFSMRVTVYRNGVTNSGRVLLLPTSLDLFLAKCGTMYGKAMTKAFDRRGKQIELLREIQDDDVVVVASLGQEFQRETLPLTVQRLDIEDAAHASGDSSDEEEAANMEQVLHRINTAILPLESKPGFSKTKAMMQAPPRPAGGAPVPQQPVPQLPVPQQPVPMAAPSATAGYALPVMRPPELEVMADAMMAGEEEDLAMGARAGYFDPRPPPPEEEDC